MTKSEADKKLQELTTKPEDWFCPQINDFCRKTCYCYVPAAVQPSTVTGGSYYIRPAYCHHELHKNNS